MIAAATWTVNTPAATTFAIGRMHAMTCAAVSGTRYATKDVASMGTRKREDWRARVMTLLRVGNPANCAVQLEHSTWEIHPLACYAQRASTQMLLAQYQMKLAAIVIKASSLQ